MPRRWEGRSKMIKILRYAEVPNSEIFARADIKTGVEETVAEIIADVRKNGDAALYRYAEKFDKAKLSSLEVTPEEIDDCFDTSYHTHRIDEIYHRVGLL